MATRKSRQNTESPTPSSTESVPTTPTTPATRSTRSIRNKQLQLGKTDDTSMQIKTEKLDDDDETAAVKEANNDDEVSAATAAASATSSVASSSDATAAEATSPTVTEKSDGKSESAESNDKDKDKEKESSPPAASTRKRRIAAAKDESTASGNAETNSPNTPTTDGKTSPTKNKRSRRSAFELLADDHPDLTPSILNRRRNSTGKIEKPTRKLSSRIKKLKQLRKTPLRAMLKRPERTVAINKPLKQLIEKQATKPSGGGDKVEKSNSASDSELIKMSRRRSDSVSKCSDMTDASSFQETKDSNEDLLTQSTSTDATDSKMMVKEEAGEKADDGVDAKSTETTETVRNSNDSGIGGDSDNSQAIKTDSDGVTRASRFSRRAKRVLNPANSTRVMNTRSRSETPSKAASETHDDEDESAASKEVKKEKSDVSLQIDTAITEPAADEKLSPQQQQTNKENDGNGNATSVSPDLVSEGVSEISVKQFYGRDFLENNLGIEKDPKLGEIVQIQEKIKAVTQSEPVADDKEETENCIQSDDKQNEDCNEKLSESTTVEVNENELNTSTESIEVDADDKQTNVNIDGAKCDDDGDGGKQIAVDDDKMGCFVKPAEIGRRDSATILNENLLVLNGEIELTSKKEKKEVAKSAADDVGEVVLYKISNGMRMNPEKLEKVLESQKLKEKERSSSTESAVDEQKDDADSKDNVEIDAIIVSSVKVAKDEEKSIDTANSQEPIRSNSMETKAIDSEPIKENAIKPAAVRGSSTSKDSRSSSLDDESPEEKIQKESHLKTLGLLTHQAAEEATIEKQKQRDKIKANKGKKNPEYTGTLKTVIKLHRTNDKKKGNQSLKMTLHKGRVKNGSDKSDTHSTANSEEDTYYTIQSQDMDGFDHEADEAAAKEHEKLLVIPEKASSFRYHPEKICEDQCFYCGGKFGLFDTPCHIAQIKSAERQKKILEYEEKLTVDSCLCDACFRHVDRRANCPSYKKRLSEPSKTSDSNAQTDDNEDKEPEGLLFQHNREVVFCLVHECKEQATHSMCRKWAHKLRKTLNKHIQLNLDNSSSAMAFLPICDKHYEDINHMMICMLCNRRLKRNHCYFMSQDASRIESLIANDGIQLNVGTTSVACKLCRYYVNLLMRPQEAKKTDFLRDHRKRLLEYHGKVDLVEDDSEDSGSHEHTTKRPKRSRKSPNDQSDDNSSRAAKSLRTNNDVSFDQDSLLAGTSTRTRQKNKQMNQQQLLEEQQRVEKRVQQEQLKLKQQELLNQKQQQLHEELRQQQLRSSNEDISNLRTNPNISMRELFPGEEEMGLQVNLPFANSWRTPDGWTKVTSTVQYDEPTRRLWEELQKPYGNQSSFLRHLLLLEKYFRNGDLLLTANANQNAITYAESVQHRLQAYDNIPQRAVSISQILPQASTSSSSSQTAAAAAQDLSKSITTTNKAVTISKVSATVPKNTPSALSITPSPKPTTNESASNSLLKSNVTQLPKTRGYTITTEPINGDKSDAVKASTSTATATSTATSTPKTKNPGLPPELICITTPSNDKHSTGAGAAVVPPPSYQLQMQLTLQQQIQQQHQNSLLLPQHTKQLLQNMVPPAMVPPAANANSSPKKQQQSATAAAPTTNATPIANKSPSSNQNATAKPMGHVIRLPDALSEVERRESKNWRPTLMPISAEKNNTDGQMYQTADGRKLPYLVQVQSGGKPYMISIHDYNRMCILRRERLLKDQTDLLNKHKSGSNAQNVSHKSAAPAAATAAAAAIVNNVIAKSASIDVDKIAKHHHPSNSNNGQMSNKVQVPNKILEQNSLIPIHGSKSNENASGADSLLRFRFSKNKSSLLKSNATNHAKSSSSTVSVSAAPLAASVTATVVAPNSMPKLPMQLSNALSQSNVVITSAPSISTILGMTQLAAQTQPIQLIPNQTQPITITNVTSGTGNTTINQSNVSSLEALFRTTNQVTTTPTTMWQWAEQLNKSSSITPIDNSATSILSKIPKSLTVIPQQKNISKATDE